MSDTILFPAHQTTQELMNGSMLDMANKAIQEHPLVEKFDSKSEAKKIADLKSGNDWYQKDLSHMTKSLMQEASNTAALMPNQITPISRSNLIIDGMNAANPGVDYGGWNIKWQSMVPSKYAPGDYHARPDYIPIETAAAHDMADYIFNNVYGRAPNTEELNNATKIIFADESKYPYLQKQLAYSQEGHDRIVLMGFNVLGYAPSEEWIQQEQAKLATYKVGKYPLYADEYIGSLDKIRKDFVYSQAGYDAVANMGSAISGIDLANVDYGQTWIRSVQDRLADPNANYSLSQERYNYAHSDFVYNLIANNANRIFGYDWGANADNVRWAQGLLAGDESMQGI
ncbi:hypothetical protein, partial [Commensalibacter communis]